MYVHPDTVDKIRDKAIIYDVVKKALPNLDIKKRGANYVALSPFTKEKTPSFYITPSKNIYKCFSSGSGGDAIKFLMELDKIEFPEACKRLADQYNIELKHRTPTEEEKQEIDEKEQLFKVNEAALKYWQKNLFTPELLDHFKTLEYLSKPYKDPTLLHCFGPSQSSNLFETRPALKEMAKRNMMLETAIAFEIGYAPDQWKTLYPIIKEKGLVQLAKKIGIIKSSQSGSFFDAFRHRLIYPIRDHRNRLVGFTSRALCEGVTKDGSKKTYEFINGQKHKGNDGMFVFAPKSINSPESKIYNKSEVLYGLNIANRSIRVTDLCNIVEGCNDVISLHQSGFTNTVGTLGTALSKAQLRLISKHTKNIRLIYDGDDAGRNAAMKAAVMALKEGFQVSICLLPDGNDPDDLARSLSPDELILELNDWTDHAILQIAHLRKDEIDDHHKKEQLSQELANLISYVPGETIRDTLVKTISKEFTITPATFRKMVSEFLDVRSKEQVKRQIVARKNEVIKLEGEPHIYPFFTENTTRDGEFKDIKINKARFVNLLKSFGYSRYYVDGSDAHTFVRIIDNLIQEVRQEEIIDHIEDFIFNEYDFDGRLDITHTHAEMLWNKFLDGQRSYFNKDIFARVRNSDKIIINKDTKTSTFFYYKNGFVEVDEKGWQLLPYTEMSGGVWEKQRINRSFTTLTMQDLGGTNIMDLKAGTFAHFCWLISDQDKERFYSLCSMIGYSMHDYYDYKLKAINLTDSSLSDQSDGRSGKTLLLKMLSHARNVTEINGKEFRQDDKQKYADVDLYTQIVGINDIVTKGRFKFEFENTFNDITEGAMVKKLYMDPFRKFFKMWILSNDPLEIHGGSQKDRIEEFELSTHFNSNHSPEDEYGIWLGRDFDSQEWTYYDNFICFCSWVFHANGLIPCPAINLDKRKLKKETNPHFLDFIGDCKDSLKRHGIPWQGFEPKSNWRNTNDLKDAVIEKSVWYRKMLDSFPEINEKYCTQHTFTKWLKIYSKYHFKIDFPSEFRNHNVSYFVFNPNYKTI